MSENLPQKLFNGDKLPKLNKGQESLFWLIDEAIKEKRKVEYDDLVEVYKWEVKQYDQHAERVYDSINGTWEWVYRPQTPKEIETLMQSWLLRALGALIKKGYLTVVPRIELKKLQ